ncbi:hypothetical protein ACQPW3_24555 [Actinosynnema sp. CA-248983]
MPRTTAVHLVGSLPRPLCDDPGTAIEWFLDHRGGAELTALPCDRDPRWIVDWLDGLVRVPALEQVRAGNSRCYEDMPSYRVRPGHRLVPGDLATGLPDRVVAAFEALAGRECPGLPVQVGVPNALDLALFTFGSMRAAQEHLPTAQAAVIGEVANIAARWGDRVQFQLETPAVLVAYHLTPPEAWPGLTEGLVAQVAEVLAAVPRGRWVLHLCYGDLGHEPVFMPTNLDAAVVFLNALADHQAARRLPMPIAHVPVTAGSAPPPTDPHFYDALHRLRPGVEVIAGVVAEDHPRESAEALALMLDTLDRPVVAVAAACGYGRRTPTAAAANMALAADLARHL